MLRLSHRGIAFFPFFLDLMRDGGGNGSGREVGLGEDAGGKDQVKGQDMGFVISPQMDSPAVMRTALDVTE